MKRPLSAAAIVLALLIGAAGAAPAAHAQTCPAGYDYDANDGCQPISTGAETCKYGYMYDANAGCIPAETTTGLTPTQQAAAANMPANPSLGADTASQFGTVMTWIMGLFAWLVGIAAMALDYAVYYTVITMGNYVHNLTAVGVTWRILRDIGNILLIFGFLSVGITTILSVNWYGFTTKMLPMLLVSAVFLNFSLFLTEAVIDTGNLFATQFFKQINGGKMPDRASLAQLTGANEGISNKIMAQLGLQTIYNVNTNKAVYQGGNTWLVGFMGIILFLITAFVMFSLAFILIARFVILLFLIIVAPVGFAGLAIPKLANLASKWWDELFEQTITAPILLLSLYIALAVITDAQFFTGVCTPSVPGKICTKDWLGFVNGNDYAGFASLILSFLLAMGLLLAVIIFSKKLSAFGGGLATKAAGALTFGAAAFAGRRTAGRFSNYAARKIRSSKYARNDIGKIFAGIADRGAKANFDIRGSEAFKNIPFGGVDAGTPQKGGYRGREEELIKERTDYAKTLRQSKEEKAVTDAAKAAKGKEEKDHERNMKDLGDEEKNLLAVRKANVAAESAKLKASRQALEAARRAGDPNLKDKETAYNNDLRAFETFKEEENEKLEPVRTKIEAEKDRHTKAIAGQEKIIQDNTADKAQEEYGEALQKKTLFKIIPRQPYDWTTAVGSARREAAGKIVSEARKDKNQKNLDRLEAILAKAEPGNAATAPAAKP